MLYICFSVKSGTPYITYYTRGTVYLNINTVKLSFSLVCWQPFTYILPLSMVQIEE